jgi:hypothetical protein
MKRNSRARRLELPQELAPEQLRWRCPEEELPFETTDEVEPLEEIVGQPRALEALRLGARLWAPGYNVYVSGISGTGRLTTVQKILEETLESCPPLFDYCYVHNFRFPAQPRLLRLPRGRGPPSALLWRRRLPSCGSEFPSSSRRSASVLPATSWRSALRSATSRC